MSDFNSDSRAPTGGFSTQSSSTALDIPLDGRILPTENFDHPEPSMENTNGLGTTHDMQALHEDAFTADAKSSAELDNQISQQRPSSQDSTSLPVRLHQDLSTSESALKTEPIEYDCFKNMVSEPAVIDLTGEDVTDSPLIHDRKSITPTSKNETENIAVGGSKITSPTIESITIGSSMNDAREEPIINKEKGDEHLEQDGKLDVQQYYDIPYDQDERDLHSAATTSTTIPSRSTAQKLRPQLEGFFMLRRKHKDQDIKKAKPRMTQKEKERQLAALQDLMDRKPNERMQWSDTGAASGVTADTAMIHSSSSSNEVTEATASNHSLTEDINMGSQSDDAALELATESEDEDEAIDEYKNIKKSFKSKKQEGVTTLDDEIDFFQAKTAHRQRKQKRKFDEIGDDLSCNDDQHTEEPGVDIMDLIEAGLAQAESDIGPIYKNKGSKKSGETDWQQNHQVRIPTSASKQKKAEMRMRQKLGAMEPPDFTDLFGGDTLAAARQNYGKGDQPTFNCRNKAKAFSELMATIPKEQHISARNDRTAVRKASNSFTGSGSCMPADDGRWHVKGMKTTLLTHQMMGTSWMRSQEGRKTVPFGGILADAMGVGKTIMAIANIVNAKRIDDKNRPTIIIAPRSLITQWRCEILRHAGKEILKKNPLIWKNSLMDLMDDPTQPDSFFAQYDIVLATYTDLMRQFPKYEPPIDLDTTEQKTDWWKEHVEKTKGVLFRYKWQRVVFDEIHNCRNAENRSSLGAQALPAKFRWLLTGTPLINATDEFFTYFRILGIRTGDYTAFRRNFCSTDDGPRRLRVILSAIMMRRTYDTKIFNKPIIHLKKNEETIHYIDFNPFERAIYEVVRERFRQKILQQIGERNKNTKYSHEFTLLLRLRQLTSHIFLVQEAIQDLLQKEDIEAILTIIHKELGNSSESTSKKALRELYNHMKMKAKDISPDSRGTNETEAPANSHDQANDPGTGTTDIGGPFGNHFVTLEKELQHLAQTKSWDEITERSKCNSCGKVPVSPYITNCQHMYCHSCLKKLNKTQAGKTLEKIFGKDICRKCGERITDIRACENIKELDALRKSSHQNAEVLNKKTGWFEKTGHLFPSAKFIALKGIICHWLEEAPDEKIIVFSQFIHVLKYAARVCQSEGWGILEFHGKMTPMQRDKAIEKFRSDPTKKVLFASLKSGGTGLNLVMANKVINIEPWWNSAIEQQAYCRVYRLGQDKETKVIRLVARDTIDDDMLAIQERKNVNIGRVIDSKDPIFREMAYALFGVNPDGSRYIWPDDKAKKASQVRNSANISSEMSDEPHNSAS